MKVTDENLKLARAVRDACLLAVNDEALSSEVTDCCDLAYNRAIAHAEKSVKDLDLAAVIAAIPEAAPLPAPTGPGWWWARHAPHATEPGEQQSWGVVLVDPADVTSRGDDVREAGSASAWNRRDFDAWVGPLAEPAGKDG